MKKLNTSFLLMLMVFLGIMLSSCQPTIGEAPVMQQPVERSELPALEKYFCTTPESDNGRFWKSGSWICYDTQSYTITVKVYDEVSNNQTVSGSMSGFSTPTYGHVSGRMWTDGKGVLPVELISSTPEISWMDTSTPFIVKTSDLGVMAVPEGATITLICNHDVEVLSPVFNGQTLSKDRLSDELDSCRMKTKNFIPAQ